MLNPSAEFDRQVQVYVGSGHLTLAQLDEAAFRQLVEPLRERAVERAGGLGESTRDKVPFVLVLTRDLVRPDDAVTLLTIPGGKKKGVVDRNYKEGELKNFDPIAGLDLPDATTYLVFDLDRGDEFLNRTPDEAMGPIAARKRMPLTIDEGLAFATVFPESLEKNHCTMFAGSRCGDRRVPALWISDNAPKLGWCWAGNRHTWLGIASCAARAA